MKVKTVEATPKRGLLGNALFIGRFYDKSVETLTKRWTRKGWRLTNTTPVTNNRGKTTKILLTFEKDD